MNWQFRIFGARLIHFIFDLPFRVWRLILWILWITSPHGKHSFYRWLCGLVLLIVDLTPVAVVYAFFIDVIKKKSRLLSASEKDMARSVFGQSIRLHVISLNPDSQAVKKNKTSAFVSFYTINYLKDIPPSLLIHELVHVWQYQKYGSTYISEAIWAQRWGGGYNYGGIEPLKMYSEGKGLASFNFEQQADIIEDYYRWKNGIPLQWVVNVPGVGEVLEKYRSDLERENVRQ